jgi:hypothetical protein
MDPSSFSGTPVCYKIRCDQLKNKSSRRVTYGKSCYSIGSKANSIYFLNDRSVYQNIHCLRSCTVKN